MKTILITGVSGFIGSQAAKHFKAKGIKVIGIDLKLPPRTLVDVIDRYEQISLPHKTLENLIAEEKPDFCLHCAGGASVAFSVAYPEEDFKSHVPVTYGLLNALKLNAPECKTIYISSAAVYGNPKSLPIKEDSALEPISPYGYHKLNCELICRQFNFLYKLKVCSVRIFSAYGAGLRKQLLWDIFQKAKSSKKMELYGTGNETRDFINAGDIVKAFEVIFNNNDNFYADVYNLASGEETEIKVVADYMLHHLGINIPVIFKGNVRAGDPKNWQADISRLEALGFKPIVDFDSGTKQYVNWCNEEKA